jgi:hypothetical protein
VSRAGTVPREVHFLQESYLVGVLENAPLNSILLAVVTNKLRDKVREFIQQINANFNTIVANYVYRILLPLISRDEHTRGVFGNIPLRRLLER